MDYYQLSPAETLKRLETSASGLDNIEAEKRLALHGPNEIKEFKTASPLEIYIGQFKSPVVGILFLAALISAAINEWKNAVAIVFVLVLNSVLGFIQEYNAEKAVSALRDLSSPKATVIRGGHRVQLDSKQLVPGDLVYVETGSKIPADLRLIEAYSLQVSESALTGESAPVEKDFGTIIKAVQVAERSNMLFSGTIVTRGRGIGVVAETGMKTELGRIAKMLDQPESESHMQKKLNELIGTLCKITVVIAVVIMLAGLLKGGKLNELFVVAIALAVAAFPEGLPIVITITTAFVVKKLVTRHVLIRKLQALETLGLVNVICTDKTGTLTQNRMTVRKLYFDGKVIDAGKENLGKADLMLRAAVLCNNALPSKDEYSGDPTETALLRVAAKGGINKNDEEKKSPRVSEIEFTSESKYMVSVNKTSGGMVAYVKGAPLVILKKCDRILKNGRIVPLDADGRNEILATSDAFASDALRVLGFAYKEISGKDKPDEKLVFLGLQAMIDPPRPDVRESILKCKEAGIKVVMITGDHEKTAAAIGRELGLETKILNGEQMDEIPDLKSVVEDIIIFARVTPEHKLKIVEALKHRNVVAMTGDGVNDAPALKKADVGISMGLAGTDVAREASDMILTDDDFTSIVNAVEEGRGIYDNIRRFLRYQLSTNVGAIVTIFMSVLFSLPLPITALQLLWINILVDGPPALSLGLEPLHTGVMRRSPARKNDPVLSRKMIWYIAFAGIVMAAGTLLAYLYGQSTIASHAQTLALTTFVLFQLFNVFNCRSDSQPLFKLGLLSNKYSLMAVGAALLAHVAIVYLPFLQQIFNTTGLTAGEWLIALAISSTLFISYEAYKFVRKS